MDDIGFGQRDRAHYATDPAATLGRLVPEKASRTRTDFQRDRDRIIHSSAFRRLKHKTQVFIYHEGDHYRTRLTHTLEVAQIARSLARAFRLDEDLAETIALSHDLGHTPFGHAGERALNDCMVDFGGFDHNAQSLRWVTKLERRYAAFDGLNLTWESLEGIVKHNGPLAKEGGEGLDGEPIPRTILDYCARHDLRLASHASLEAQVAAIADDIAYDAHDIDDGLRAGLLTLDALKAVPFLANILGHIDESYPGLDDARRIHEVMRRVITHLVEDVIEASMARLQALNPQTVEDIRGAGETLIAFSPAMQKAEKAIKTFMFREVYRAPDVMRVMDDAQTIVRDLFAMYRRNVQHLPEEWRGDIGPGDEQKAAQRIADYIAGMTDRYALELHRHWFDATPELR